MEPPTAQAITSGVARVAMISAAGGLFLYIAMVCFVMTSLLLASSPWAGGVRVTAVIAALFLGGVAFFLVALLVEFLEMRAGLKTIGIKLDGTLRESSYD